MAVLGTLSRDRERLRRYRSCLLGLEGGRQHRQLGSNIAVRTERGSPLLPREREVNTSGPKKSWIIQPFVNTCDMLGAESRAMLSKLQTSFGVALFVEHESGVLTG